MIHSVQNDLSEESMRRWLNNLLSGAGSIIALYPSSSPANYDEFLPTKSIDDTLRSDWWNVGDDIAQAMELADRQMQWDEQAETSATED